MMIIGVKEMGIRLVKDADNGEIYILPDEKKSMKNVPQFMQEDAFPEIKITTENYEANNIIADLNKQLDKKDKQLKKASKSVITVDKSVVITCGAVLAIIIVLGLILGFAAINNNNISANSPEQIIVEEIVDTPVAEADEPEHHKEENADKDTVAESADKNKSVANDLEFLKESCLTILTLIIPIFGIIFGIKFIIKFARGW